VIKMGAVVFDEKLEPVEARAITLYDVQLGPGDTILLFRSDKRPAFPGNCDGRRLIFMVRSLEIEESVSARPQTTEP
jgi:hypothetical protein